MAALLYNSPVGRRTSGLLILPLLFFTGVSSGQSGKAQLSYKLLSIHVKGVQRFKDGQIIAATGLKPGQYVQESDFKLAVQKLGETGLFTDVAYKYEYSSSGCSLDIQVTENDKLAPIRFENFVWFSDDELISLLQARLPLFTGRLPLGGNLADQLADSLKAILTERKISGEPEYQRTPSPDGSSGYYVYKLDFHPVVIRNVDFSGAGEEELPALQAAAKGLSGRDYLRSETALEERLSLLPVYRARGYLKARFADARAQVAQDGDQTLVDITFLVDRGPQYKLAGFQWTGNAVFPAARLQELIHLNPGDLANAVQLERDIAEVQKLYGTQGYLFARVDPAPTIDADHLTVAYQLNVTEGDLYRMGDLVFDGLDAEASRKLAAQWQLKKGAPYDNSYLPRFFSNTYRDVGLNQSYSVVPKQSVNQRDKTVSVALHFVPKT